MKIEVDASKAIRKVEAVLQVVEGFKKSDFPDKVIEICDKHILPVTPVATGQLKDGMGGTVEGDTVTYGSTGSRTEGGTNEDVLYHLEMSHGGRDAFFIPAAARASREIENEVGTSLKAKVQGSYP